MPTEAEHVQFALWHGLAKTLQWLMDNDCPIDLEDAQNPSWHDEVSEIGLISPAGRTSCGSAEQRSDFATCGSGQVKGSYVRDEEAAVHR